MNLIIAIIILLISEYDVKISADSYVCTNDVIAPFLSGESGMVALEKYKYCD
jgi:hypothetical protein